MDLEAMKRREPAAFDELLREHGSRLLRAAYCMCGNETEAEDMVQETFLQAFRCADRFRGESKVYTWLYGILLNVARSRYRQAERNVNIEDVAEPESPLRRTKELTKVEAVASAIDSLDAEHARILRLRYFDNLTVEEIAARLSISAGTVKSRLHYAREKMRGKRSIMELVGCCQR